MRTENSPEVDPERTVLDDAFRFVSDHVVAGEAARTAMVLYAAATHAMRSHVAFGRMLFTSQKEESGKTLAMMVTVALCSAPLDADGTPYALQSALAAATNEPERPVPTLYQDEISQVFGRSGLNGGQSKTATVLRKGYLRGAQDSWSVNRVAEYYSIFTPFLMTGLRTAVPRDIRSRCIVIEMAPGRPRKYFSIREAVPFARVLQDALANEVKRHADEIEAFRALGLHPKMDNRKLEVWESLCAVAYCLGGPRWLARAVNAFTELALDTSEVPALSPTAMVVRDVAAAALAYREVTGGEFAGGLMLADELRHLGGPMYAGRSSASLACLIRDSVPLKSTARRIDGNPVRGYPVDALQDAWNAVRPIPPVSDLEPAEEENPFAVDDDEDDTAELSATPATPDDEDDTAELSATPATPDDEDTRIPLPRTRTEDNTPGYLAMPSRPRGGMLT